MTRISCNQLDEALQQEMFTLFWSSISKLDSSSHVASFFADLLSDTEEIMLAKRFVIAVLLKKGKKPIEITRILNVSFSTVRSVNEWRQRGSYSTNKLLDLAEKNIIRHSFLDKIDELLDQVPPRRGTNWQRAGKEKWQRKKARLGRSQFNS